MLESMDKEEIKALRKAQYQAAKKARDNDPHYQALKAQVKEEQRARYRAFKAKQKQEKESARLKRQQEKDDLLIEAFGLEKLRLLKFDDHQN